MAEIRCPKCKEVFQVNDSDYAQIVTQVRDSEFEKELKRREEQLESSREKDLEMARLKEEQKQEKELAEKNAQISDKEKEIAELKAKLASAEKDRELAVVQAISGKDKELNEKTNEILSLKSTINSEKIQNELKISSLKENYETKIKDKNEQIEYYKDFKARQSTKMIGESLEQHCFNQFNSLRMTAFPDAYFEKDNDAKSGSKGDFIFRDYADGTEYISIMFEMKNEADETKTKHKNEDFFKELDKDRNEKKCEYAVLVSMLESDSDLYNNGIVDVSYKYPKMYVVRPQFFIPLITLLKNAAMNSLQYQRELQLVKNQQLDLVNFESNLNAFKNEFSKNFKNASDRFADAINNIDKTIEQLEKIKKMLTTSEKHLIAANNKVDDVSIKKLTKNAPSVRAMFDELKD